MKKLLIVLCLMLYVAPVGGELIPPPPSSPPCLELTVKHIENEWFEDAEIRIEIRNYTGPTFVCIEGNSRYGQYVNKWFLMTNANLLYPYNNVYEFTFRELDGPVWYTIKAFDDYHGVQTDDIFLW